MRRSVLPLFAAAALAALTGLVACVDGPSTQSHPSTGRKLAIRPISNKTQQFGLEDTLLAALRDEFLRDGRYQLVPESEADDVIAITLTHYLLTPIGYDATLAPISYKLRITADVKLSERATNRDLWNEQNLDSSITYPNQVLSGGQNETQAQATIWTILSPMIVKRVVDGFNSVPVSTAAAVSPAVRAPR